MKPPRLSENGGNVWLHRLSPLQNRDLPGLHGIRMGLPSPGWKYVCRGSLDNFGTVGSLTTLLSSAQGIRIASLAVYLISVRRVCRIRLRISVQGDNSCLGPLLYRAQGGTSQFRFFKIVRSSALNC